MSACIRVQLVECIRGSSPEVIKTEKIFSTAFSWDKSVYSLFPKLSAVSWKLLTPSAKSIATEFLAKTVPLVWTQLQLKKLHTHKLFWCVNQKTMHQIRFSWKRKIPGSSQWILFQTRPELQGKWFRNESDLMSDVIWRSRMTVYVVFEKRQLGAISSQPTLESC